MVRVKKDKEESIEEDISNTVCIDKRNKRRSSSSEKVKVGFFISRKVAEEFKRFCILKYGKYEYGLYSEEVERALTYWMDLHTKAQTNLSNDIEVPKAVTNPPSKVYNIFKMVLSYISNKWGVDFDSVNTIPKAFLLEGISAVRGTDPRTIRKWYKSFLKFGLIKEITEHVVEVM